MVPWSHKRVQNTVWFSHFWCAHTTIHTKPYSYPTQPCTYPYHMIAAATHFQSHEFTLNGVFPHTLHISHQTLRMSYQILQLSQSIPTFGPPALPKSHIIPTRFPHDSHSTLHFSHSNPTFGESLNFKNYKLLYRGKCCPILSFVFFWSHTNFPLHFSFPLLGFGTPYPLTRWST